MASTTARPTLHVEGTDDQWSLINLLIRHGVGYLPGQPFARTPPELPEVRPAGSVEKLVGLIETSVVLATDRHVGFVLDADAPIVDRWRQVRARLERAGVSAPADIPPAEGFIVKSKGNNVGVWLMPDNRRDGKLEDFLAELIAADDPLIGHAREATAGARDLGATFSEPDLIKAEVHAWLAWQDEPGKPYGQAMMARYFQHDAAVAARFVAWFRRLYGLDGSVQP